MLSGIAFPESCCIAQRSASLAVEHFLEMVASDKLVAPPPVSNRVTFDKLRNKFFILRRGVACFVSRPSVGEQAVQLREFNIATIADYVSHWNVVIRTPFLNSAHIRICDGV
jgi:hypothetical protein